MKIRLINIWNELLAGYWFIPSLMIAAAIGLSTLTISFDLATRSTTPLEIPYLWRGGLEGARSLLEVIAGSMMTVASLTFSITVVTYAQASAQFGPRLLRKFARDMGNQIVLGTFVATFVYCLLGLWSIRSRVEGGPGLASTPGFIPYLSVSVAFGMALASLGVLIYFIHHVSQSIYAPNVIANVAEDLMDTIEKMFPAEDEPLRAAGRGDPIPVFPPEFEKHAQPLPARDSGYLQGVDYLRLLDSAVKHDLKLALTHRPGQCMICGDDLARVWPAERVNESVLRELQGAFIIGKQRVAPQDVEFAIDQLVEVAVRALSAAINDPFTAMNCIDWLGVALSRLAEKKIPPPYYRDVNGECRILLINPVTFEGVTNAAFDQIRQQAGNHAAVLIRMLEVIAVIEEHTQDAYELRALKRQAEMVRRISRKMLPEQEDLKDIDARYRQVENATSE